MRNSLPPELRTHVLGGLGSFLSPSFGDLSRYLSLVGRGTLMTTDGNWVTRAPAVK